MPKTTIAVAAPAAASYRLPGGVGLAAAVAWAGTARRSFLPPADEADPALFLVAQGIDPVVAQRFYGWVRAALRGDHGTPASRLLRAVTAGCRQLESTALHRFELAGFGLSAALVEPRFAHLVQLAPGQAYALDDGAVQALPEEPMWGAERLTSAAGRRWEVELEVTRLRLRPDTALLLCSTSVAAGKASTLVAAALRRPAADAARHVLPTSDRYGPGPPEGADALVVRAAGRAAPAAARLRPVAFKHPPRRHTPEPGPSGGPKPRLEAWGLARERRAQPLVSTVLSRMIGPAEVVYTPRRRRRPWRWAAVTVLGIASTAAVWLRQHPQAVPVHWPPPRSIPAPPSIVTPAPTPALAGRTLLDAAEGSAGGRGQPFAALAVAQTAEHTVYVLDQLGQLVSVVSGGSPGTSPGVPPSAPALIAARDGDTLCLDSGQALWQVSPGKPPRGLAVRNASWQRPVQIATYAGNLYVLDPAAGQIWRHDASPSTAYESAPLPWLQPGNSGLLDGAISFAIDGAIWVLREDGTVLRLNGGQREPFEVSGLSAPVAGGALYTEAGYQSLYVADNGGRRLLRIGRDGKLQREIANVVAPAETVRGLWVDEPSGRALILTTGRLQEVPLS